MKILDSPLHFSIYHFSVYYVMITSLSCYTSNLRNVFCINT